MTKELAVRLAAVVVLAVAKARGETPRVVVSIADRKLALVENGRVVKVYDTAVGAEKSPSPSGRFKIAIRLSKPTWYGPKKVVSPGPNNPLGTRWLGLDLKGFGIHGTSSPRSIGRAASHGCIRMRNRDVEELFDRVKVGDIVELRQEPIVELLAALGLADAAAVSDVGE